MKNDVNSSEFIVEWRKKKHTQMLTHWFANEICIHVTIAHICIQNHIALKSDGRISWYIKVKFNYNGNLFIFVDSMFVYAIFFFRHSISVWQIKFSLLSDSNHFRQLISIVPRNELSHLLQSKIPMIIQMFLIWSNVISIYWTLQRFYCHGNTFIWYFSTDWFESTQFAFLTQVIRVLFFSFHEGEQQR